MSSYSTHGLSVKSNIKNYSASLRGACPTAQYTIACYSSSKYYSLSTLLSWDYFCFSTTIFIFIFIFFRNFNCLDLEDGCQLESIKKDH